MFLKSLHIVNFKCFPDYRVDFSKTTNIYGRNAVGKSSIFDAYMWLLFGKDANDRENFEIKPVGADGKTDPDAVTEVTGVFTHNDRDIELKRTFAENWVKPRGETERVFKGNECRRFIDGVEVGVAEFDTALKDMSAPGISIGVGNKSRNISVLKLLSNHRCFNELLHWTDRKSILFALAPALPDAEILTRPELSGLAAELDGGTIEAYIAKQRPKLKKLDSELEQIPARIDEAKRSRPQVSADEYGKAINDRNDAFDELAKMDELINSLAPLYREFKERQGVSLKAENELAMYKERFALNHDNERAKKQLAWETAKRELYELDERIKSHVSLVESKRGRITKLNDMLDAKRHEVAAMRVEQFPTPASDSFVCPTCKRQLDDSDIERETTRLCQNFMLKQSERIAAGVEEGQNIKSELAGAEKIIAEAETFIAPIEAQRNNLINRISDMEIELDEFTSPDITKDEKYNELLAKAEALSKGLVEPVTDLQVHTEAKARLNAVIERCNQVTILSESARKIDERVRELDGDRGRLNQEKANIEKRLYQCELFTKIKVSMLEDRLGGMFAYTRIKLIDVDEKGRENECCTATLGGVDYEAVNTAGRALANLDIINTLSKAFGVACPVFFDNREGVNSLPDTEMQTVNLFVTENDEKLRVEGF